MAAAIAANAQGSAPYWLIGTWSDGESLTYIFSYDTVTTLEYGQISAEGKYTVSDGWVEVNYKKSYGDSFILSYSDKRVAVEGGEWLYKVRIPEWLLGTWTDGETKYIFTNGYVTVIENGNVTSKCTYTIDNDFVNVNHRTQFGDCFILDHSDRTVAIEGGDWLYKVRIPEWLPGTWTDGETKYIFTNGSVAVIEDNAVTGEGIYTIDDYFVNVYYDTPYGDCFILGHSDKTVAVEGGEWLYKIK